MNCHSPWPEFKRQQQAEHRRQGRCQSLFNNGQPSYEENEDTTLMYSALTETRRNEIQLLWPFPIPRHAVLVLLPVVEYGLTQPKLILKFGYLRTVF